jgi:hypothetical protein
MKHLSILLFAASLAFAQTPKDTSTQSAAKPNNPGIKPHVIVVPPNEQEEQGRDFAMIQKSIERYTRARISLDQLKAKYKNDSGEDENHVLGRHYAALADDYRKSAIPMGERLIEDFADFRDSAPPASVLNLNTMIVDAQHLNLILDGLQAQDRKWFRNHAKDRGEPSVVVVVQ